MRDNRLVRKNRTSLPGAITDRDDEIPMFLVDPLEAAGSVATPAQPVARQNLDCERVHPVGRLGACARRKKSPAAGMVENGLRDLTAGAVPGAKEKNSHRSHTRCIPGCVNQRSEPATHHRGRRGTRLTKLDRRLYGRWYDVAGDSLEAVAQEVLFGRCREEVNVEHTFGGRV